jgi:translation initiation factor 2 subunit 2
LSEEYLKNLDRALEKIPKKTATRERFEMTEPSSRIFGAKTIIFNFSDICSNMNRDPRQVLKFLSKEMATAASIDGGRAIFQGKFNNNSITQLLNVYCNKYVVCPICKRPDTNIEKEDRFSFLICEACGAKSSITSI